MSIDGACKARRLPCIRENAKEVECSMRRREAPRRSPRIMTGHLAWVLHETPSENGSESVWQGEIRFRPQAYSLQTVEDRKRRSSATWRAQVHLQPVLHEVSGSGRNHTAGNTKARENYILESGILQLIDRELITGYQSERDSKYQI